MFNPHLLWRFRPPNWNSRLMATWRVCFVKVLSLVVLAESTSENVEIYFHFLSLLNKQMSQVFKSVLLEDNYPFIMRTWWRHQIETFSALLAICAGNSPVPGEFPAQRPLMRSFDVFFDLRLNKRLSKQSWGWWFKSLLRLLWRHSNVK